MHANELERKSIDTDELPIVLEQGGPTAGSSHIQIVEGECGNCGYDRIKTNQKHGECVSTCMLCESTKFSTDNSWSKPSIESSRLHDDREYADGDGPLKKVGEYGGSRMMHGNELFAYDDSDVMRYYKHGRDGTTTTQINLLQSDLKEMVMILEKDSEWLTDLVDNELRGKQIRRSVNYNSNAIHIGELTYKNGLTSRIWVSVSHMMNGPPIIHFPASADNVCVGNS